MPNEDSVLLLIGKTAPRPEYTTSCCYDSELLELTEMSRSNSALIAAKVIENSFQVLSILYMGMVQAVDILKISDRLAPRTALAYSEIRSFFPAFTEDTPKYEDIAALTSWLEK